VAAALRRVGSIPLDETKITDSFDVMERVGPPEGRFFYLTARGLWLLATDPAAARPYLDQALAGAMKSEDAGEGILMRSKIHLAVAMHTAKRRQWRAALDALADAAAVAVPAGCVLGLAVDVERTLVVLGRADGVVTGWLKVSGPEELETSPILDEAPKLPRDVAAQLTSCAEVKVIAPARQRWWTELGIPENLPWSYVLRSVPATPDDSQSGHGSKRLVVADPDMPAALGLPRLATPTVEPGVRLLRGREANPTRVLSEMRDAGLIDFRVHGVADAEISEHTALVLSPDERGRYLLTPDDLRSVRFVHRPVVILASCGSALRPTTNPDSSELAGAFIRAGARAVFATATPVPDSEADAFFARVHEALTAGHSPAVALHDARRSWPNSSSSWVSGVLAFE
jgi:hypothetical protein